MSVRLSMLGCTVAAFVVAAPVVSRAQHGGAAPTLNTTVPKESQQFAFLIGQWELEAKPGATTLAQRIHGTPKLVGSLKAWRVFDGAGIEDEMRLTDASGNPLLFASAMRVYDAAARQWRSSSLDVYRTAFSNSTGEFRNGEMLLTAQGVDGDGKAYVSRTRYHTITPTSFKLQQDRSFDGGKTWTEGTLKVDAKRVAASAPR